MLSIAWWCLLCPGEERPTQVPGVGGRSFPWNCLGLPQFQELLVLSFQSYSVVQVPPVTGTGFPFRPLPACPLLLLSTLEVIQLPLCPLPLWSVGGTCYTA